MPPPLQRNNNITGLDVSKWQGRIDWRAAVAAGCEFAFVKATEGVGYEDPMFGYNQAVLEDLIPWAPYHFARPSNSPRAELQKDAEEEAKWFAHIFGSCDYDPMHNLPPVLDIELGGIQKDLEPSQIVDWCLYFLTELENQSCREAIIYTGYWTWRRMRRSVSLFGYPLWQADYAGSSNRRGKPRAIEVDGHTWDPVLWQFTAKGTIAGVRGKVDTNRVLNEKEWELLCPRKNEERSEPAKLA